MWRERGRWAPPVVCGLAVAGVAFGFAAHDLGVPGVWFDESASYELARLPFWNLARYVLGPYGNMALYFVVLHAWLGVLALLHVAPTEVPLRLPSAVFSAASAAAVYALGERLSGKLAGLAAAAIYIPCFLQLYSAQQARAYSLVLLLICLGWYAFFAALSPELVRHSRLRWAVYTTLMVLAIYAHFFGVLVLLGQIAAYAGLCVLPGPWREAARRSFRAMRRSVLWIAGFGAPLVAIGVLRGGESMWLPPVQPSDVVDFFTSLYPTSLYLALAGVVIAAALAAAAVACVLAGEHERCDGGVDTSAGRARWLPVRWPRPGTFALACWTLVPLVVSYALTQPSFNVHLFYHRYLVVIVPPLCLLIGAGVALLRWWLVRLAAVAALAVVALPLAANYYPFAQLEDYRTPAHWVEQHYQTGDGIVCAPASLCDYPFDYYFTAYPGPAHFDIDSPGYYNWAHVNKPNVLAYHGSNVPLDNGTLAAYAAHHKRIFVILAPNTAQYVGDPAVQGAQAWLASHAYTLAQQYTTQDATIDVYAQSPGAATPAP